MPDHDDTPIDAERLFRSFAPFVAGFLVRLGVVPHDIDDLLQEVFLVAHKRGGYLPGPARPQTWLAEIALRVVSTRRRTERRRGLDLRGQAPETATGKSSDPFERTADRQALRRVHEALATIDAERRAVFVLFELDGESCESIAAGFDVPVGTIYSRLHSARQQFRQAYERACATPFETAPLSREKGAVP